MNGQKYVCLIVDYHYLKMALWIQHQNFKLNICGLYAFEQLKGITIFCKVLWVQHPNLNLYDY